MNKNSKSNKLTYFEKKNVDLPVFLNDPFDQSEIQSVDGTNVVRVPFGKRLSKKKRPEKNQNIATLILPLHSINNPPPPPFVA